MIEACVGDDTKLEEYESKHIAGEKKSSVLSFVRPLSDDGTAKEKGKQKRESLLQFSKMEQLYNCNYARKCSKKIWTDFQNSIL